MRKLAILSILLLSVVAGRSQTITKFQLNAIYGKGNIVYYPTVDILWITKSAFTAKAYPAENTLWTRYMPATTTSTVATVSKGAFDSLKVQFDALAVKVKTLETTTQTVSLPSSVKVSQNGFAILKVVNDSTVVIPSFIPSNDIDFIVTENTIQPILKKH